MPDSSQTKTDLELNGTPNKPKKRDRSASEEKLMDAGREVFSKHGFDGATTKMIAKKADVNESLIGRYFDGKAGLLIAIIKKFVDEIGDRSLPYPPQNSLGDELACYVEDRVQRGCEKEDFAKIIFNQALVDKKFKKQLRETVTMQIDPLLIERVQRLFDLKKIKQDTDIHRLCEEVDTYLDGTFFFDRVLIEEQEEKIAKDAVTFVRSYSRLYESV